jgi:hypothetical protein
MTLSRVVTSISTIEAVVEVRDFDSPFVDYKLEPIGAAGEVLPPGNTFNRRN